MKRVLLTTVHRPLGVESETCSPNISAEMYHAQVTRAQGVFSIRSICTGWGLEFIAANLRAPTTVLHYPTLRQLERELRRGYDFLGISFVVCTFPKTVELCNLARRIAPRTKIVLGGYGTVLGECDQYADLVCREEGVVFFRRILHEPDRKPFVVPPITRTLKIMSVTSRPETIIPAGLGCSRGCDFCCTSHFFHRRYVPLLRTGKELHAAMKAADPCGGSCRSVGVVDEDFLADKSRIDEMIPLNAAEVDTPILFSCLTSMRSIAQYTRDELLFMGLAGAWIGVESKRAVYAKLKDIDARAMFRSLKEVGIIPLASMIIGYDWHDEETVEEEFQYLLSLQPSFSQMMIYSPCPQTPLYRTLLEEGRLLRVPHKYVDGFHTLFKHPHLSAERLEQLIEEFFHREYEELGPSVCRVLETQLSGYITLRDSPHPLFRARARENRRLALDLYPLLRTAIREAPSQKVRAYLSDLRARAEELLQVPPFTKVVERAVPALAAITRLTMRVFPNPQPPTTIHRYRADAVI